MSKISVVFLLNVYFYQKKETKMKAKTKKMFFFYFIFKGLTRIDLAITYFHP